MKKVNVLLRIWRLLPLLGIVLQFTGQAHNAISQSASVTGDPWKMLVIVYREIDVDYVDIDGVTKHLRATMPPNDVNLMIQSFLNLPHRGNVFDYSGETAELEAHIVFADRPLTSISYIGDLEDYNYWPSPDDTQPELASYVLPGMYDSVIIFWQASDPDTGQSIPCGSWGWGGYRPGWNDGKGITYATVFNLSWVWQNDVCEGEVFLHEWLHGVTFFYMSLGFPFPPEDLHGAEEAGYVQDPGGCWETWLRDYMRGLVYVNGERTALFPETWQTGSITTYDIQGWRAEYYNNENLSDLPIVVRDDADIDFEWYLDSPHPLIQPDHFSSRWTKTVHFEKGHYELSIFRDDGVKLWIDDVPLVDKWERGREQINLNISLDSGFHDVRMEAFENDGWASAKLSWVETGIGSGFCDGFEEQTLEPGWTWIDPLGDSSYSLTSDPGRLRLFTPDGGHDLYLNLDAPRMLQPITGNFVASAKVSIPASYMYQGAGLLIWGDNKNYVRLELITGGGLNFIHRIDGEYVDEGSIPLNTLELYISLQRTGNTFTAWYSRNGVDWTQLNNISFAASGTLQVGVHLINQWQDHPIWAEFDYFDLEWCGAGKSTNVYLPIILK
jgi:regulation of enolase protein 1 (concanavalin A-like superfamily)